MIININRKLESTMASREALGAAMAASRWARGGFNFVRKCWAVLEAPQIPSCCLSVPRRVFVGNLIKGRETLRPSITFTTSPLHITAAAIQHYYEIHITSTQHAGFRSSVAGLHHTTASTQHSTYDYYEQHILNTREFHEARVTARALPECL